MVIPTIGRPTLPATVASVLEDGGVEEVVIVADARAEVVHAQLSEFADDPRVRIVPGDGWGAARARQRGTQVSTAPIVLFLDDDVFPSPGLASAHARRHRDQEGLVVIGYMPVGEAYLRAATARVYADDYLFTCEQLEEEPDRILNDLWAGNVSMSRASIERVPPVAATSPYQRREDQEFGLRCARAGLTGVFDRSLIAEHQFERSLRQFLATASEQAVEIAQMRAQYPELGDQEAGTRPEHRLVVWARQAAGIRLFGLALRGVAYAGVFLAARLGARRLEDHGVVLLRTLVQRQAVIAFRRHSDGQ